MSFDFKGVAESKAAYRAQLAKKPIAEKLWLMERMAERALATRKDTSAPPPNEPWEIPKHWRWARLGDVATVVGGGTPRTDRADYFGGNVPWITPADLSKYSAKTISRGARNITEAGLANSGAQLLPAGTVLFSSRAPIGYVAIAANPVATNQGFKSFVLREELLPDFVYYYLQRAKELAVALASGTTFLEISGKKAAQIPIPVPPLDEQRRIVAEIEKQFTRLDAGVAALRRVQANLKRYRAAVLKAACEGRLVPTEAELARQEGRPFETGEQLLQRILSDRRKNWTGRGQYLEPMVAPSEGCTSIPAGWASASIKQMSTFSLYGPRISSNDYAEGGYVVLRTSDISESGKVDISRAPRLTLTKNDFEKYQVRRGDLLITRTGSLGTLAIFDDDLEAIPGAYLIQFRLATSPVTTRYLFHFLKSPSGQRYLTAKGAGVGRPNLNAPTIEALAVPLPPLAEQKRIVAEVERRLSVIDELETVVTANLARATHLRQSVLQHAFASELSTITP